MKKTLYALLTMFVLATLLVSPAAAGISGTGVSGVQVQNLTGSTATVNLDMYPQIGGDPIALVPGGDSIDSFAAKTYYMPSYSTSVLPSGAYSMVVSANQLVAGIASTKWADSGGYGAYSTVSPSTSIIIPLVVKNLGKKSNSQFTIQNTDTAADATDVQIQLFERGSSEAAATKSNELIGKGASRTYTMNDFGVLPDYGSGLPGKKEGFIGVAKITSSKPLVVQTFIDVTGSKAVSAFSGVDTNSAASTLYCPLVRSNWFGDTGISVYNPTGSAVDVTITFSGATGSAHSGETYTQTLPLAPYSSDIAFQGLGGNSRSGAGLPYGSQGVGGNPTPTNDGFFGVATLTTTGAGILAQVNDTVFGASWALLAQSSYNCVTLADAGSQFALPLIRKNHTATQKLTTGVNIQNTSNSQVTVSMTFKNGWGTYDSYVPSNAGDKVTTCVIPALGSCVLWTGSLPADAPVSPSSGWFGSAVLTASGGQVAVLITDGNSKGYAVALDNSSYSALKIQ